MCSITDIVKPLCKKALFIIFKSLKRKSLQFDIFFHFSFALLTLTMKQRMFIAAKTKVIRSIHLLHNLKCN